MAIIAGPTASGKSALALALAEKQPSVVINADSAQVYRDLSVLSARPTEEELARAPHRLYGTWDGATPCSAAEWADAAKTEIAAAHNKGRLPILVGGTGLYLRTLLDGIAPIPPIEPEIRAMVRAMPVDQAHARLTQVDPEAASRLHPADSSRIARALEVMLSTGLPLNHWQQQKVGGIGDKVSLQPLVLLPPRDWLYERCDRRFGVMMEGGAVEEVAALMARELPPDLPVMRAIGVAEIAAYIEGSLSCEEAVTAAQTATRQYAKRQYTWFRRQPPVDWTRHEKELNGKNITYLISLFQN